MTGITKIRTIKKAIVIGTLLLVLAKMTYNIISLCTDIHNPAVEKAFSMLLFASIMLFAIYFRGEKKKKANQ